jgi:signal transduction histidine kinase
MKAPESQVGTQDMGVLANGMAHAIRNPLSSIMTAATLVQEDAGVSEETAMLLGVIVKESRHLNKILAAFLEYVKPHTADPAELDLVPLVRGVIGEARRDGVLAPGVVVDDMLPDSLPVFADEQLMRSVLFNIVSNAGEAMGEHGKLQLSGQHTGVVVLTVEDSGRGFSPRELERAFDPFFSNTPEGTGLGLTIARVIVEDAGGHIYAENREGENGARIRLELPKGLRI